MPKVTLKTGDEFLTKIKKLDNNREEVIKRAVYDGAGTIADAVRARLNWVIGNSDTSTGDLEESLGITDIERDSEGVWNAKIGFDGYDRKGVANQLKARVLESGKSGQKKRPFFWPAVKASKGIALKIMEATVDREIEKIMK